MPEMQGHEIMELHCQIKEYIEDFYAEVERAKVVALLGPVS